MIEEILNEEQVKKILDADHTWEQGTTLSGVERESYVCWLNKSEWQWLFNLIDSWILRSWPESAGIPDFDASAIQLTRYDAPSGYYGWHDDDYPGANRVLSSIIMLQNADEGGELQFRDQNIDLKPGQGVVFPSPTEHQVTEVTKGTRYSLVRWLSQRVSEVKQEQQESFEEPDAPAQDLRVVELENKTNFANDAFFNNFVGLNYQFNGSYEPSYIRDQLSGGQTVNIDGVETHVHGGVSRMTGLISMVEDANESGEVIPLVVMRDENNNPIEIHTQEEIRPILNKVRQRKNIVESAHNKVMKMYQDVVDRRDDENADIDDRLLAADQGLQLLRDYRNLLQTEIDNYDSGALPDDLNKLKMIYQERIEAHALGHTKKVRGVLTQQGIDLPASCVDEANALQKVSVESVKGHITVDLATTNEEATTAYNNAISAIDSIWPLNTPLWKIEGTSYVARPSVAVALTESSITIEAFHPPVLDAANNDDLVKVKIASQAQKIVNDVPGPVGLSLTSRTAENPKGSKVTYTPQGVQSGDLVRFIFTGRNLCGPSEITVNLTIP